MKIIYFFTKKVKKLEIIAANKIFYKEREGKRGFSYIGIITYKF